MCMYWVKGHVSQAGMAAERGVGRTTRQMGASEYGVSDKCVTGTTVTAVGQWAWLGH